MLPSSFALFLFDWLNKVNQMPQAAVISLGMIGAGTNNARIAGMLRNLSSYYYKDANLLFCVIFLLHFAS